MIELNIDHIHSYLNCPTKYKFRYEDKIDMPLDKSVLFKKAVHKTSSYFFFAIMGGWMPTSKQMKDKWANIWEETISDQKFDTLELLMKPTPSAISKKPKPTDSYNVQGFEMIHNFYHFNKDNPGVPIAVDLEYRVPIGSAIITGKFELIREIVDPQDGKRYVEIVDFKTGTENVDPFLVKHDFNLTMASYAFRNLFHSKEDRLKYHYLKSGRDITTFRLENDFKRLQAVVDGVVSAIDKEHFYPRQSFMCKTCEFRDICDRAKF